MGLFVFLFRMFAESEELEWWLWNVLRLELSRLEWSLPLIPFSCRLKWKFVEVHHEFRPGVVMGDGVGFDIRNVGVKDIKTRICDF